MAKLLLQAAPEPRSYTDFEPRLRLLQAEESDTLVVDLSGFNKEQLRVTVNTSGSLKIFGERPMDGGSRWARFVKHLTVPKYPNIPEGIEAKFDREEGKLYVVLPKRASNKHTRQDKLRPAHATQRTFSGSNAAADEHQKADETSNVGASAVVQSSSRQGMAGTTVVWVSKRKMLAAASVAVAVMVLVGVAIFLGIKLRIFRGEDQN